MTDTTQDPFGRLVDLAGALLDVPIAVLTLADDRRWLTLPTDVPDADLRKLAPSLCRGALSSHGVTMIEDLAHSERLADHPLARGEADLHFFGGTTLPGPDGQPAGFLCVMDSEPRAPSDAIRTRLRQLRDVFARELAHQRLETKYQAIFSHAQDALVLIDVQRAEGGSNAVKDLHFRYREVNPALTEATGVPAERIRDHTPQEAFGADLGASLEDRYRTCVQTRSVVEYEDESSFPAGRVAWHTKLTPILAGGEVTQIAGIARDITARKETERAMLTVRDEERLRIGEHLHDSLASELLGAAMMARSIASQLRKGAEVPSSKADRVADLIGEASEEVRQLSHALIPMDELADDLPAALRQLADQQDQVGGTRCTVSLHEPLPTLETDEATQLYRIAAEATSNAVKHAEADDVEIRLEATEDALELVVADDGRGIPAEPDHGDGVGLRLMKRRADLIGAALEVESTEGEGTVVRCRLPLETP